MEKNYKRCWLIFIGIYLITLAYSVRLHIQSLDYNGLFMCVVALLALFSGPFLFFILQFKPVYEIYCIQVIFAYIACVIGNTLGGYSYPLFDKILHFSSGFLMLTVGIMVYFLLRRKIDIPSEELPLFFVFINCFNMTIAVLWEFFEYFMLIFFQNDCINHFTQGVCDSMNDMLCALFSGLILTVWILKNNNNFFVRTAEKFYTINNKKRTR